MVYTKSRAFLNRAGVKRLRPDLNVTVLGNLGLVLNMPSLAKLGFPAGALLFMVGLAAFGIGTWRAKVLPRYAAVALMLWEPGSIATGLLLAPISPLHERGTYSDIYEAALS